MSQTLSQLLSLLRNDSSLLPYFCFLTQMCSVQQRNSFCKFFKPESANVVELY